MVSEISIPVALYITLVFAVFCNIFGIYLLTCLRKKTSIQSIIVINLSITDAILAIFWIVEEQAVFHGLSTASLAYHVIWSMKAGVYITWYATIYLLTADRFFGCTVPLRHRMFMQRAFIRKIVICSWVGGCLIGILQCFHPSESLRYAYKQYAWAILDITFLVLFIVTYISIFIRLTKSRRSVVRGSHSTESNKFLYMVSALLVTFVVFECIPTIIVVFWRRRSKSFEQIKTWFYSLNLLFDPLLYIFLQADVRSLAGVKICSLFKCRKRRGEYDIEGVENSANVISM